VSYCHFFVKKIPEHEDHKDFTCQMSLTFKNAIKDFETYLRLEKSLSENSIEAYKDDVLKLERFFEVKGIEK
jgi:hypothetical protein